MKFKERIAKSICISTILLLFIHILLPFALFSNSHSTDNPDKQLKITKLFTSSDNFIFEKENNEDFEEFRNLEFNVEDLNGFVFIYSNKSTLNLNYSNYQYSLLTLAKWLKIKHILI